MRNPPVLMKFTNPRTKERHYVEYTLVKRIIVTTPRGKTRYALRAKRHNGTVLQRYISQALFERWTMLELEEL